MGSKVFLTTGHTLHVPDDPADFLRRLENHHQGGAPVMLAHESDPTRGFLVPLEVSGALPVDGDKLIIAVSVEGAKSWLSDSPGWGAMGLQELTEELEGALRKRGIFPPYLPGKPGD